MLQSHNATLALTMVLPKQQVRVVDIMAGQRVAHRLSELGISRGVTLEILNGDAGPLLVAVRDTRLALERGVAQKIRVQLV